MNKIRDIEFFYHNLNGDFQNKFLKLSNDFKELQKENYFLKIDLKNKNGKLEELERRVKNFHYGNNEIIGRDNQVIQNYGVVLPMLNKEKLVMAHGRNSEFDAAMKYIQTLGFDIDTRLKKLSDVKNKVDYLVHVIRKEQEVQKVILKKSRDCLENLTAGIIHVDYDNAKHKLEDFFSSMYTLNSIDKALNELENRKRQYFGGLNQKYYKNF